MRYPTQKSAKSFFRLSLDHMAPLRLALALTVSASLLLAGCASYKPTEEAPPTPRSVAGCSLQILQSGKRIVPHSESNVPVYELAAQPFRIELQEAKCKPSLSVLSRADFAYVAHYQTIVTVIGYEEAGGPEISSLLAFWGGNPRTTLMAEIQMATHDTRSATKVYEELCVRFGTCPNPIKAYRSYWPFADAQSQSYRSFAEISRFSNQVPLSQLRGEITAVVYSEIGEAGQLAPNIPLFRILQPHPFILRFRGKV